MSVVVATDSGLVVVDTWADAGCPGVTGMVEGEGDDISFCC